MPMRGFAIAAVVLPLVASPMTGLAQIDPRNIPKPPAEELERFEPFLGTYDSTADFGGQDWQGSIEIKRVINGWYVEWTYSYRSTSGIETAPWLASQKHRAHPDTRAGRPSTHPGGRHLNPCISDRADTNTNTGTGTTGGRPEPKSGISQPTEAQRSTWAGHPCGR